jgi:GTPase
MTVRAKPARERDALMAALSEGLPTVTLVGRVNAGKSTLFNRIAGGSRAIASPAPGTTRDLNFARARHGESDFMVVDSGGLDLGGRGRMSERVVAEALRAVGAADVVVMVLDGRVGFSAADREALDFIRATGCQLVVAVNKIDRAGDEARAAEFYASGAANLFFISAAHGIGVGELLDEIISHLPAATVAPTAQPDLKVALVGRPNVGKSSLLNRICGLERAIVDEIPGTTRDAIDVRLERDGMRLVLIDTAGIRRRTRVEGEVEHAAVGRALQTVRRADVLVLVTDASEGITDQDARLARLVERNGRAMVIACNKWDLAAGNGRRISAFVRDTHERFPFLEYAAMVFTSALTGDGVGRVIPAAVAAGESWRTTFKTSQLNRILAGAVAATQPPMVGRKPLRLMYVTQVASAPPALVLFANLDRDIPVHYARFLESRFRSALKLVGTPLRLTFRIAAGARGRSGPSPGPRRGREPRGAARRE